MSTLKVRKECGHNLICMFDIIRDNILKNFLPSGPVLHLAHIDQTSTDHAPINDLLTEVGAQRVNFEKDARVLTL